MIVAGYAVPEAVKFVFLGPLIGAVARVAFSPLTDRMGGAIWTLISGVGLIGSIIYTIPALTPPDTSSAAALDAGFNQFLYGMLAIFLFAGIGNASTFKQMPMIFEAARPEASSAGPRRSRPRPVPLRCRHQLPLVSCRSTGSGCLGRRLRRAHLVAVRPQSAPKPAEVRPLARVHPHWLYPPHLGLPTPRAQSHPRQSRANRGQRNALPDPSRLAAGWRARHTNWVEKWGGAGRLRATAYELG